MLALSGQTPDIDIWMNKNLLSWESLWGIQEVWPAQQRCYHISSSLRETEKVIIENINLVCPDSRHISFTWWDCISRNWRLERVKLYRLELAEEEKKEVTDNLFRNIWTLKPNLYWQDELMKDVTKLQWLSNDSIWEIFCSQPEIHFQ